MSAVATDDGDDDDEDDDDDDEEDDGGDSDGGDDVDDDENDNDYGNGDDDAATQAAEKIQYLLRLVKTLFKPHGAPFGVPCHMVFRTPKEEDATDHGIFQFLGLLRHL